MHANLVSVYAKNGEHFEMSPANARDLVSHAGWTYKNPADIAKEQADGHDAENEPRRHEAGGVEEHPAQDATQGDQDDAPGEEDDAAQAPGELIPDELSEADFAGHETREEVLAFLAGALPDFKAHHAAKRETIIAQAIEASKPA